MKMKITHHSLSQTTLFHVNGVERVRERERDDEE